MTTQNPVYASQAKPWLKYYDQKYIEQTLPTVSAFEYVCQRNKNHLNDTALDYYGRKFTYADLIVNVKKTAAALRGVGVQKGDIVTVVSVMTPEVIALFYAADMIGATLNLVDPRYSVEGIHEYIEEVDSHLLVCLNVVYERCRQAAKRTNVEKVIVLSPADSLPPVMAVGYKLTTPDKNKYASNVIRWKQFIKGGEGQSTASEPYDPDHACVVVHTGGTTGSPKGVMLTDNSFNAIAQNLNVQRLYEKAFDQVMISPTPLWQFIAGQIIGGSLRGLYAGGIILLLTAPIETGLIFNGWSFLVMFLNGAVFSAIGVVVSFLAKNHADVPRFSNYIIMPMAYLCNTFFSTEKLPGIVGKFVAALPLSQTSHLMRSISSGEAVNYTGIGILLLYLLVFTVAASWFIYKKKNL